MEEFPASKVHLQPPTSLTGKFPSKRKSRHTGQFGSGHREISALQWGVVGGGGGGWRVGLRKNSTYQLFETPKNQIPSDILNCLFPSNNFTFQGHIIFSKSPSQRKIAWRTDILRNRSIGCPCGGAVVQHWSVIITQRFRAAPVQANRVFCSGILTAYLTAWKYFPLYKRELLGCLLGISPYAGANTISECFADYLWFKREQKQSRNFSPS